MKLFFYLMPIIGWAAFVFLAALLFEANNANLEQDGAAYLILCFFVWLICCFLPAVNYFENPRR
ncbi:hypothetical protein [Serratia sp. UGAL515B_01]|uniref:hypothetical protein n=1 Tax=Serratia sp. UGAL515B_01 TaxID=2986763 RepID=UPI0029557ADC|nr:hypothetical protein [Serratia sp. UGAL515B_01]WON77556.1 hypothetical protein OK023_02285 [Serratia sp. UGAL515B_01]